MNIMSNRHLFFLSKYQLVYLQVLFENRIDGQYCVLQEDNGFSDIVQYMAKWDDLKICTVQTKNLDINKRVG